MDELLSGYIEDLKDNLLILNDGLMNLKNGIISSKVINDIFRVAHTIKGNSAGIEFLRIEKVMHSLEDILQEVRNGDKEISEEIIELLFTGHDFLEDCIEVVIRDFSDKAVNIERIMEKINQTRNQKVGQRQESAQTKRDSPEAELLAMIAANQDRGYTAYQVVVTLNSNCPMKSVRAWFVYEQVENYSILVYSDPPRPSEETFRNPGYSMDEQILQMVVLSDKPLEELSAAVKNLSEIDEVSIQAFTALEPIELLFGQVRVKREILHLLNNIGVAVLDDTIPPDIHKIISYLQKVLEWDFIQEQAELSRVTSAMVAVLREAADLSIGLNREGAEVLVSLCHELEIAIKSPQQLNDHEFINQMSEYLEQLKSILALPEQKIGEILVKKGLLTDKDVENILEQQQTKHPDLKFGQVAVIEQKVPAFEIMQVLKEQRDITDGNKNLVTKTESSFVRVPVSKVDSLMDMLGELLILNSQLEDAGNAWGADSSMLNILSRTAKLIKGIQSLSMSLRMVEIRPTLHRLTRVARDTAAELNKRLAVTLEGENTEIDRSAAERLFDPLMHLVRNAVSHGIESEAERVAAGKKPEGQVNIKCYSKRGNVYIEVSDDGRGMDYQQILSKARLLKLADEQREYSEDEILRFIFEPGFSTQDQINNISGRGVGMNVVQEEIRKSGGKVDIFNQPGNGCSFVLRIPMNLAVVNGTIVEVEGGRYIIPTLFIKEFFVAEEEHWVSMQGRLNAIRLRDCVVPVLWSGRIFETAYKGLGKARRELVILEMDQKLLAFPVEKIISRQEIVSKPLINELNRVGYASGASILGDGSVALILDVEAMFSLVE